MAPKYGSLPFKEAIDFFNQKQPQPTQGWEDVYGQQHDHAFMVAGAKKLAILESFANAVQGAIEGGEPLADFQKRFDQIVAQHGWDYHGSRGWRSRLIYETNIRQAYNAGREAQMADPAFLARFPYTEYRHSGAENYRPQHKAWDRMVLRSNDPWWQVHSPSNGYGCKCKKFPRSERWAKRHGRTGPDKAPADQYKEHLDKRTGELRQIPKGIDPGFEHTPGQSWLRYSTPQPVDTWPKVQPIPFGPVERPPLPPPTPVDERAILPDGLSDTEYVNAFLEEFDAPHGIFADVTGEPLAINDYLFRDANGQYNVSKDKIRHRYMRLLARALIAPDEIWSLLEPDAATPGRYRIKRRYIKRWVISQNGQPVHGFSAFEYGQGIWTGNTAFTPYRTKQGQRVPERDSYLEKQREGVLLYRKQEEG
ncbi:PBECR2 nuclease fold domain-containing protein [Pontibacterium granulatum]|uniref:PBECR2 nuclease fold domain-containing protein n=1 Tax=Pontibacterium granulatum TaxID=2036029 RepID=UPI00249AA37D|nr:PBECR2 nuclease fold domain-containing protein [Pontibacterium granulatum]MDI3326770.1 PBECR2 nuclease fold domain-containing protein [Pontibacterium granulatum]